MKQLIEEQREEYVRIASYTNEYGYLHKIPKYEDVWNWHKQSLKQFIDELIEWEKSRITYKKYDVMFCKKCKIVVRERTSHHSEDGFSECCGKELERLTGQNIDFTPENETIENGIDHLKELKEQLN